MAMPGNLRTAALAAALLGGLLTATARGQNPDVEEPPRPHYFPADDPHHTMQRAGYPDRVACWAAPSETPAYVGYWVGGGSPCKGRSPMPSEGTWGWDYAGRCIPRNVALKWWLKPKYQGGMGQYKTDGPHLKCGKEE
jgi:hypothetical protein